MEEKTAGGGWQLLYPGGRGEDGAVKAKKAKFGDVCCQGNQQPRKREAKVDKGPGVAYPVSRTAWRSVETPC